MSTWKISALAKSIWSKDNPSVFDRRPIIYLSSTRIFHNSAHLIGFHPLTKRKSHVAYSVGYSSAITNLIGLTQSPNRNLFFLNSSFTEFGRRINNKLLMNMHKNLHTAARKNQQPTKTKKKEELSEKKIKLWHRFVSHFQFPRHNSY